MCFSWLCVCSGWFECVVCVCSVYMSVVQVVCVCSVYMFVGGGCVVYIHVCVVWVVCVCTVVYICLCGVGGGWCGVGGLCV